MQSNLLIILPVAASLGAIAATLFLRGRSFVSRVDDVLHHAPFPIWAEEEGSVVWMNRRCTAVFGREGFGGLATLKPWPPTRASDVSVVAVERGQGQVDHYTLVPHIEGNQTVYFAQDAGALVQSETELERFLQTLSATFAHVPVGLAVFDRDRDLTLFNPALSNLLEVSAAWLATRPSLSAFLDRLRNEGSLPEPRDYNGLKEEFATLESGAFEGSYEVEWMLPNGRVYRVTGKPHADGGAALLFEDVSQIAALEAQYRTELIHLQGALECISSAVAIFDAAGEMTYANDAFDTLWGCDLSRSVQPVYVTDVSKAMQAVSQPDPAFGEMRDFVLDLQDRSDWTAHIRLRDGHLVRMDFTPIAGGRVVCEFRKETRDLEPRLVETG